MLTINLFKKDYDNNTMQKVKNEAIEHASNKPRNYMFNLEYNSNHDIYIVKSKKYDGKMFAVENQFKGMNKKEIECFIARQYINECVRYL